MHCAGGSETIGPITQIDSAAWRRTVDLNVNGTMYVLKHAARELVRGGSGSFIGISSIAASNTHRWFGAYGVSKSAVDHMMMLAADELYPTDSDRLRATGYLVRSYFRFNRNTWMEEVVEHTSKSFLGLTMNCSKCHDHKFDPLAQQDFYRMRAVFEPYQVRTDRAPGESNFEKDGLPRVFDCNLDAKTFLFVRGDDLARAATALRAAGHSVGVDTD